MQVTRYSDDVIQTPRTDGGIITLVNVTGGCYNELVVAYFGTGGGVKWRKR